MTDHKRQSPVDALILMVSGGADSTSLLLRALQGDLQLFEAQQPVALDPKQLVVLHINHQLRGQASDEDQRFVEELCKHFGVICYALKVDLSQEGYTSDNIEARGREARYAAANKLAYRLRLDLETPNNPTPQVYIVTAHTADDKAETFLMNAARGSGLAGLASLQRRQGDILRPLLECSREDNENYLRSHGQSWRVDQTNFDTTHLRSALRHTVLPQLESCVPEARSNIARTSMVIEADNDFIEQQARSAYTMALSWAMPTRIALQREVVCALHPALQYRVMRHAVLQLMPQARLEAQHLHRALQVATGRLTATVLPRNVHVRLQQEHLIQISIGPLLAETHDSFCAPWHIPGELELPASMALIQQALTSPDPMRHNGSEQHTSVKDVSAAALAQHGSAVASSHGLFYEAPQRAWLSAERIDVRRFGRNYSEIYQKVRDLTREWLGQCVFMDLDKVNSLAGMHLDWEAGGTLWVDTPQPGDVLQPLGMHNRSKKVSDLLREAHIAPYQRSQVPIVRAGCNGAILWVAGIRMDERVWVSNTTRMLLRLWFHSS